MAVLPKKRGAPQQSGRGSATILHDLSNKGRVLSERVSSGSKRKPSGARHISRGDMFVPTSEGDGNSSFGEDGIDFHENRSTIMSNFEEWIKLSTDNKITTKNSWHFALIDYFHDLNVIKDGDNINFQRASATLDGCVKIYSSRVESAASETGKLLSGLATKRGQAELEQQNSDDDNDDDDDDQESATSGKRERKINRVVESTLVPFESLQIKKLDQELIIDPLFKKALAEFDEGGAKSLLLNTLNIDSSGRVVFDAATNPMNPSESIVGAGEPEQEEQPQELEEGEQPQDTDVDMDLDIDHEEKVLDFSSLKRMLYDDGPDLSEFKISPSIDQLKTVLSDVNKARSILTDVNSRFQAEEEEEEDVRNGEMEEAQNFSDFNLDNDFDDPGSPGTSGTPEEGLQQIETELRNQSLGPDHEESFGLAGRAQFKEKVLDSDLMAYFDDRMKTNWRGPEHWRVTALKQSKNFGKIEPVSQSSAAGNVLSTETPKKQKKEQVLIDFFAEDDDDAIEEMFRKPKNQFQISKRPEERRSPDFHLLPDDIQFNSKRLVTLFLKPHKTILTLARNKSSGTGTEHATYTDEQFFASQYEEREKEMTEEARQEKLALSFHQAEMEDMDNFGGIDFNDVLTEGPLQEDLGENKDTIESQIFSGGRKARPEYVNYSRVAKRVDIKLLKDNLWKSIKIEADDFEKPRNIEVPEQPIADVEVKQKTFKDVVDVIGTMYRPEEKKDLSTSFCFICLLHLANEHSLSMEANANNDNFTIKGF